jgi:hypothetical protein
MHRRFFKEAHLNGGPLISGAAQERRMMFLEELVAVVAGEEASSLTGKAGEPGYTQPVERERERPQDRNPVAGGCLPRRDAGKGGDSCIHPTRAEMQWRRSGGVDQLGRRRTAGIGREALVVIVTASRWRYARGSQECSRPAR